MNDFNELIKSNKKNDLTKCEFQIDEASIKIM